MNTALSPRSTSRSSVGSLKRAAKTRIGAVVALGLASIAVAAVAGVAIRGGGEGDAPLTPVVVVDGLRGRPLAAAPPRAPRPLPPDARVAAARRWAAGRGGVVAFATYDRIGGVRGLGARRTFVSASVVKAMLLVAYLRAHRDEPVATTAPALDPMITASDNDAADEVYAAVGDAGLYDVARRARLRDFTVAGHWGNAQLSARDMAHLFFQLPRLLRGAHREYGIALLTGVVESQRWGIAAVVGHRWRVAFKGGWRTTELGQLVHQAALLRSRDGRRRLGVAVLTDGDPSLAYGIETVEGIAARLLRPAR